MRDMGFRSRHPVPQVLAMRIVRSVVLLAAVSSLSLAAACSGGRTTTAALAPPPAPVKRAVEVEKKPAANPNAILNGRWEPTDADGKRLYYLQLKNGGLASRSPSTNATTARGTYKVAGDRVNIVYQSSQSSTPINLTCSLAGAKRMTCSSADGSNTFSIVKAA